MSSKHLDSLERHHWQYVTMSFCMFRFNLTVLSWLWLVLILGSYLLLISTCHVGWWRCGLPLQWSWCLSLSLLRQVLRQKVLSHCAWTLAAPSKDHWTEKNGMYRNVFEIPNFPLLSQLWLPYGASDGFSFLQCLNFGGKGDWPQHCEIRSLFSLQLISYLMIHCESL